MSAEHGMPRRISFAMQASLMVVASSLFGLGCASDVSEFERFPTGPQGPSAPQGTQVAGAPAGWAGGGVNSNQYEVGRDTGVFRRGGASAYVRSRSVQTSANSFIYLSQALRADRFRGKRLRLSGYLRASDVTGDGFGFWMRADAATRTRAFDNMNGRRRMGTQEWDYAEIVLDIPDDVIGLVFGALLSGPGIGWMDDLRLEVVDSDVPVTAPVFDGPQTVSDTLGVKAFYERLGMEPVNLDFEANLTLPESEPAIIEWVRSQSVSFSTDDPGATDADLAPLRQMIGNASIVGVGEGTHGTREFFRMKHRVFQYLVRNLGFDHFSIEATLPEALAVDHYVQTGVGDPVALVRAMRFWTWSTEEVYDLVRWMRAWNASGGQPRLRFSGFDMQVPGVAIDSLDAFAEDIGAAAGDSVRAAYQCLGPLRTVSDGIWTAEYKKFATSQQDACRAAFGAVDSLFASRLAEWSAAHGSDRTLLMQRLARLVSQWEDLARASPPATTTLRDRYMAENVAWWRSRSNSSGMMLWAHNAHVGRQRPWMGSELAAKFGTQYLNVALTFSLGSFNAVRSSQGIVTGGLQTYSIGGSWPASIEALFDATGALRVLFDARAILTSGTPGTALRNRLTMRSIGAVFDATVGLAGYQTPVSLPDDYDLVIWFRSASASRLSLATGLNTHAVPNPD
jgi:erythromycin esterase